MPTPDPLSCRPARSGGDSRTPAGRRRAGRERLGAVVATACLVAAACGDPVPGSAPAPPEAAVVATFTLATGSGTPAIPISVPAQTAQVTLRLPGELGDADSLTAELVRADAPDGARRWPVDPAAAAADGASASVTLPVYALTPGDYAVTVWRGDAEPVQRYVFRVAP